MRSARIKAIKFDDFGDEDGLRLAEAPPDVHTGEFLVDVVAAGVNRTDLLQREVSAARDTGEVGDRAQRDELSVEYGRGDAGK